MRYEDAEILATAAGHPIPTGPREQGNRVAELQYLYPEVFPPRLHVHSYRSRVPGLDSVGRQTTTKMIRAVSTLERWMWSKYGETRPIEAIPPADLDRYLEEFWAVLVRDTGTDFLPVTMRKHRYCIDRFLTQNGYAYSITTASEFARSQVAYQNRVYYLQSQLKLNP